MHPAGQEWEWMRSSLWFVTLSLLVGAAFAQNPPVVAPGGVLNAASFATTGQPGFAVAPGSLVAIFGSDLASSTAAADSIPLSTSLGNVSVKINDVAAPLMFVSNAVNANQINAQIPWEVTTTSGAATVTVTRDGIVSQAQSIDVAQFSPGVFFFNTGSAKLAIATGLDGQLAQASNSIAGVPSHPVSAGDALIIYATGLGPVDQPVSDGGIPAAGVLARTTTNPKVLIGGIEARLLFSGHSPNFVGVNQVNVIVPSGIATGDTVPLQIQIGGITTSDSITIAVQ